MSTFYIYRTTRRKQRACFEDPPTPSYSYKSIRHMFSKPLSIYDSFVGSYHCCSCSAGWLFVLYNVLTTYVAMVYILVMGWMWQFAGQTLTPETQPAVFIQDYDKYVACSSFAQLTAQDSKTLRRLAAILSPGGDFGNSTYSTAIHRIALESCCLFIGLHTHRHIVADAIFTYIHATLPADSMLHRCVTLFCHNMDLNNMTNVYPILSPMDGASSDNRQITTFSQTVPTDWNSPILMTSTDTVYGTVLQRLFDAVCHYGEKEFQSTTIDGLALMFGTNSRAKVFAHFICIIYDHSVVHRLYHETNLAALRKGVSEEVRDCDTDVIKDIGALLAQVTCRMADTISLLPRSKPLLLSIMALDVWIREQPSNANWLEVATSSGSTGN